MIVVTGTKFETLIDSHGPDQIQQLIEVATNALEQLEKLAFEKDRKNSAVDSIQTMAAHFELEDNKKQEEWQRNAEVLTITVASRVLAQLMAINKIMFFF